MPLCLAHHSHGRRWQTKAISLSEMIIEEKVLINTDIKSMEPDGTSMPKMDSLLFPSVALAPSSSSALQPSVHTSHPHDISPSLNKQQQ